MSNTDPFKAYEAARKLMYSAMEKETSEPIEARYLFDTALDSFHNFLEQAAKGRGMYRELEKKATRMRETCENKLRGLGKMPKKRPSPTKPIAPAVPTPAIVRPSSPDEPPKPPPPTINISLKKEATPVERAPSPRVAITPRTNAPPPKTRDSPPLSASAAPSRLNNSKASARNTDESSDLLQAFASRLLRSAPRSRRRFMPDSDSDDDSDSAPKSARPRASPIVKHSPAVHEAKHAAPTPLADHTPKPRNRTSLGSSTTVTTVTVSSSTAAGRAKTPMRIDSDSDDDEFVRWPRNRYN
jgi:hypothetical protein